MTPWGAPDGQSTEEEKTQAWFTEGSACYAGTTWKWTAAVLKDSEEGKPFQWTEK